MRLVEPWIKVENFDGVKIMKRIERACRTCYRSEDKISDESYKNLLTNCLNRGHESVLEHEKITVRIYSDIGTYKDLTRHRFASFSVESTRYCSYNKDKYGNEIAVVNPVYMEDKEVFETWKKAVEDMEKAMKGMLDPEFEEKVTGSAEIRQIFKFSKVGLIAGCHVLSGTIKNNSKARILRDDIIVYNGAVNTLQHEKDQVKEVKKDMDCGMTLENCQDYKEGDIIEVYELVEVKRK